MDQKDYGIRAAVNASYEETVPRVIDALKKEGFGALTEINVKETIRKKLGKDFPKYIILGGCNPELAYQALTAETEIGLLLPCNVIVYEKEGKTFVSAQDPEAALSIVGNPAVAPVAKQARERLARAIDSLESKQQSGR
ncbi:MAG TPA: DUF302 domain-containing protein [Candidatus Manganitrophaceae bacterium]|nr:DUF302 domain-containing protein [Candidatus Manganitrophaceae bacterium]